jgi:hypothetical protein
VAHAGEGEGNGELGWAKGMGCSFFSFSSFLSSFPNSIYSPKHHLNSNKFEFKSYKLNTGKIMLQHECINILIL